MLQPSIHPTPRNWTTRQDRAQQIVDAGLILPVEGSRTVFEVQSQSSAETVYTVDVEASTCDCLDRARGHICKHLLAAQICAELLERTTRSEWREAID